MKAVAEALAGPLRRERGERMTAIRPLPGGANSEVWEVETDRGGRYLAKRYPHPEAGGADRLGTEYDAFLFLRGHGVLDVPEPVCALPADRLGVYGFVAGARLRPGEVGSEEVRRAADFLQALHALRGATGAERLPIAKEACFSLADHEALVRGRLDRFRTPAGGTGAVPDELKRYLEEQFQPHFDRVAAWVREEAGRLGLDRAAPLPQAARTLSPSDFGFHNAIRRPDGRLVFVDFEYFGWDDPAKTVADFYLQPAVPVPAALRDPFYRDLKEIYARADLTRRLPLVYLLLSLKWCLIILNVFLRPQGDEPAETEARKRQLDQARTFLSRVREEFAAGAFPFGGE